MGEAIEKNAPYAEGVAQILECRRERRQQPPPIAVSVPNKVKQYCVKPANLTHYDALSTVEMQGDDDDE